MKKLFITLVVALVPLTTVSIGYSECGGDVNCSGAVDGSDLAILAADIGTTGCGTCDVFIARMKELEDKVGLLEDLLQHFSRNGNDIYIDGANLHVLNGTDSTDGGINGLGNLIVGYNKERGSGDDRTGSHNIVVGMEQNYNSFGSLVAGRRNTVTGEFSSVTGGRYNTASGSYASISGGGHNKASGDWSSVSAGQNNKASGDYSFVGGGGDYSSINGNEAFSHYSAILGGMDNIAGDNSNPNDHGIGIQAAVSGGIKNNAIGDNSSVSGGYGNTASGYNSSVSGGWQNVATGHQSSVSGGYFNTASGDESSVSGGLNRTVVGEHDWQGGSLWQDQ